MIERFRDDYLAYLDTKKECPYGTTTWGLLEIRRTKTGTFSVTWGRSTIVCQGQIPISADPKTYPLTMARAAIGAMDIDGQTSMTLKA